MKKVFILFALCAILTGCSGISNIGKIGNTEFHGVHFNNFWSKSHSMIVVRDTETNAVQPASIGVGNGIVKVACI